LATAGARGITAELLKAIARHFRPRLYLIGSNRLDAYPPSIYEGSDADFARSRADYLRAHKASHPEKSLGALNREFDRLLDARTARANITEMARHSGAAHVHYLACDVLDREALAQAVGEVVRREGKIDLVIHAAGLNRAASLGVKRFEDFQAVRDVKVRGYVNLKRALGDCRPRLWCNFGSFLGLTGQVGETDYAAANDFLAGAAQFASQAQGTEEFTIGWGLWRSVGLGADPVRQAFLQKTGLYTGMATEEGIHHFVREVNLARHDPWIVQLGAAERQALTDYLPDYFQARTTGRGSFYIGRVLTQTPDEAVFERVFDLSRDAYLQHHLVNGYATLPGTFVPEIAAQAATRLVPGLQVVAFQDAAFHHFLRIYDSGRTSPKKIHARVVERTDERAVVRVRVLTDVVAPNGTVLTRDKVHFEISVLLSAQVPPAPRWEPWIDHGAEPVPDPYHFPAAPVRLTGPFVSTAETRVHPLGKRATYRLQAPAGDPVFSTFLLPSILLDGLARLAVLGHAAGEYLPLAAPATIRRIDLYEARNDGELARAYDRIELYAMPRDLSLAANGATNRFVAVRPDGHVILQLKDVTGTVMGYVHQRTGEFVAREMVEGRPALLLAAG
ncbi:MAG: SDR family oxidoreductase, partial [Chloroflexota bacterium]